jgi:F-box and leucine-rich repeat protein GRR1
VFAGDGVNKLRRFLTDLFNSITEEMNPQGDEDVGDSASYVHDDDSMDVDDVPPRVTFSLPVLQEQSPISPSSSATIRPLPRLNGHANHHATSHQPIVRSHGTSTQDIEMSTLRAERHGSSRDSRSTTRSPTHSPPPAVNPTPGPSRLNPTDRLPTSPAGSEGSSAGAFFRTYQGSSADGRPDGTLTPDLVFAEIGHGHGPAAWHGQEQNQTQAHQFVDPATLTVDDWPQYGANASHVRGGGAWRATSQNIGVGQGPFGTNGAVRGSNGNMNGTYHANVPHSLPANGTSSYGINGGGGPSAMTQGPPVTREERGRGRPRASREPQDSVQVAPTPPGHSQGRGAKRTFRSALNSVEQHTTSFLFGRPFQDGDGSSAGAASRKDDSTRGY